MEYMIAAYTDTGIQKETNQDSICVRRAMVPEVGEVALAVVCDGMGGLKKGEVASAAAVSAFGSWFDRSLPLLVPLCGCDFSKVRQQWVSLLSELHEDLKAYAAQTGSSLGTTVAAMLTYGDRYLCANVGDSRVYERKKILRQLTQDHSLVAREVAAGRITEEESRHHPQRNVLLQCLGAGNEISPSFIEGRVQHDALYLLCSDGLVHELYSEELRDRLDPAWLNSKSALTDALSGMTELCKRRGETDNISAILLKTSESSYVPDQKGIKKLLRRLHPVSAEAPKQAYILETAQIIHTQEVIGQNGRQQTR